jgi:hypothetical protein
MDAVTVQTRLVVEYRDTTSDASKASQWCPPLSNVTEIDGNQYVTVGYSGDRGFARFCGGDVKLSNPLKFHTWLEDAIKSRNDAVAIVLDKVAEEKLLGYVKGQTIRNKRKHFAEFVPEVVKVTFPAVKFEGTEVGPCEFNVKFEFEPNVSFAFECTELAVGYVRVAMLASKGASTERARLKHDARLSTRTGVSGVWGAGKGRIKTNVQGADGKKSVKTKKCPDQDDASDNQLAVLCKNMKERTQHAPVKVETDEEEEVEEAEVEEAALEVGVEGAPQAVADDGLESQGDAANDDDGVEVPQSHASSSASEVLFPLVTAPSLAPAWQKVFGPRE